MAYDSYKIAHTLTTSPKNVMMRDKREQVKYLYSMCADKEDGCTLNGKEFSNPPRIFDVKISKSSPTSLTMETIFEKDRFYVGDVLFYDNSHWLCYSQYVFHGLYCKGIFIECNWLLKWQNAKGEIIERWAVILSASKYNDGEDGNATITLGSDQLSIAITIDEESLRIKRDIKFFIDNNTNDPTVYELTGTNNITATNNGHGITSWIVKECAYSPTPLDLKFGVCNYCMPTNSSEVTIPEKNETCCITGKDSIKVGATWTTFKGFVADTAGNVTAEVGTFSINSSFDKELLTVNTNIDNQVKIKISDKHTDLIGFDFELIFTVGDISVSKTISITEYL